MVLCVKRRSLTRELAVRSIGPRVVLEVIALLSITSAVPALSAELNDCGCVKIKTETVENKTTAYATLIDVDVATLTAKLDFENSGRSAVLPRLTGCIVIDALPYQAPLPYPGVPRAGGKIGITLTCRPPH